MKREKELDQFYTNPLIAKQCIDFVEKHVEKKQRKFFVEPAAGTGSFSSQLKNCIALDIDPKIKKVIKKDFLLSSRKELLNNKIKSNTVCVIGNPPFGKNSSLAVKFFNHSAKIGDVIAFILPKTFRKKSVQAKIDKNYWLVSDIDLPKNSFIHEDQLHDTPCCFQIWERRDSQRVVIELKTSNHIKFVKKEDADFAIRRVGGRTGKAILDYKNCAEVSHYFIKIKKGNIEDIISRINDIDFSSIVNSTAGVRSLSKGELIEKLEETLN